MILDQKEQFFFRFAVMIKPGEAYSRTARNVAHGSRVITLFSKNTRGGAQDQFELLIVTRGVRRQAVLYCRNRSVFHSCHCQRPYANEQLLISILENISLRFSSLSLAIPFMKTSRTS